MSERFVILEFRGKREKCRVIRDRGMGTLDVERIRDGKCFRVSGLPMFPQGTTLNI